MMKKCVGCGELMCAHCGQCHTGVVCLWSAPACQSFLALSALTVDERGVYRILLRRIDYLQQMVARSPRTLDELRDQRMEADVVMGVMLQVVAALLPNVLQGLVERLLDLDETLWGLDRYRSTGGRDDGQ